MANKPIVSASNQRETLPDRRSPVVAIVVLILGIALIAVASDAFLDFASQLKANNPVIRQLDQSVHDWCVTGSTKAGRRTVFSCSDDRYLIDSDHLFGRMAIQPKSAHHFTVIAERSTAASAPLSDANWSRPDNPKETAAISKHGIPQWSPARFQC
jgi:hypothetical protein